MMGCPFCEHEMVATDEPFVFGDEDEEGAPVLVGCEHLECPRCGFITFTEEQMEDIRRNWWSGERDAMIG